MVSSSGRSGDWRSAPDQVRPTVLIIGGFPTVAWPAAVEAWHDARHARISVTIKEQVAS